MRLFGLMLLCVLLGPARSAAQWDWGSSKSAPVSVSACWEWDEAQRNPPGKAVSPQPKSMPKWIAYDNGWWKSAVSGHWWHAYYGHYDKDTVWSDADGNNTDQQFVSQWELENQPEPPNQHYAPYQNTPVSHFVTQPGMSAPGWPASGGTWQMSQPQPMLYGQGMMGYGAPMRFGGRFGGFRGGCSGAG